MEPKWKVRSYEDGDEDKIKDLVSNSIYLHMDDKEWFKWWKWQHKLNPSGEPIIYFADDNGLLAGQYEIIKFRAKYNGDETIGFHSQDTMTHRDYRRQGIFKTLADKSYESATKEGGAYVFGFPNQNSHPGFIKKLEFFDICVVPNVFKTLNVKNTLKRRIHNNFMLFFATIGFKILNAFNGLRSKPKENKDAKIVEVKRFDDRIDDLWRRASSEYKNIVIRDRDHVNWRYVDIPHRDYTSFIYEMKDEIRGYVVLSIVKKEGFTGGEIIDLFGEIDESVIGSLIKASVDYFRSKGVDAVYCWLPDMDVYKRVYKKLGFMNMNRDPQFIGRVLQPDVSKEQIKDYSNWFVTMGDSDFH